MNKINLKQLAPLLFSFCFSQICLTAIADDGYLVSDGSLSSSTPILSLEVKTNGYRVSCKQHIIQIKAREAYEQYRMEYDYKRRVSNKTGSLCVVKSLEIWHKGVNLALPKIVYNDMAEVEVLSAKPWKGGLKIHIIGSDAASAYENNLIVSKGDRSLTVQWKSPVDPDSEYKKNQTKYAIPRPGKG